MPTGPTVMLVQNIHWLAGLLPLKHIIPHFRRPLWASCNEDLGQLAKNGQSPNPPYFVDTEKRRSCYALLPNPVPMQMLADRPHPLRHIGHFFPSNTLYRDTQTANQALV